MLDKVYVDRRVQRIQLFVLTDHLVESWGQEIINVGRYVGLDIIKLGVDLHKYRPPSY